MARVELANGVSGIPKNFGVKVKSILHDVLGHLPTNWLDNVIRLQKREYFGHVTRHNGLEKTLMQGMVAGNRSREKPRQIWEIDITDIYVWYDGSSKQSGGGHESISQRHLTRT